MTRSREQVLYEFALEDLQDNSIIDRYLEQYPEFAEDLLELLHESRFSLVETVSINDDMYEDKKQESALAAFLASTPPSTTVVDLFEPFKTGAAFAQLARSLEMPRAVLVSFRDRLVVATSIPARTVARIASELNASIDNLLSYLALPPRELGILRFKAAEKPSDQEKRTFREIVMSTEMSDDQRELLLKD